MMRCSLVPFLVYKPPALRGGSVAQRKNYHKGTMLWQPLNLSAECPPQAQVAACTHFGFLYLNLLVQLYGDSVDRRIQDAISDERSENMRRIQHTINTNSYKDTEDDEYDFIVVGAGAAGCVVANRLSAVKHWRVLLLEAGPEQPDVTLVPGLSTALLGSNIDWGYRTHPNGKSCLAEGQTGCDWPRGKTMGGSSSINSLAYVRGNRLDYDTWAELGNAGWSYKDVLPYFKKSERNINMEGLDRKHHGVKGEQFVSRYPYFDRPSIMMTEAFNQRGLPILDFNGAQQEGTMQGQAVSLDGERVSTNNAFIQPIRWKRHNLVVKTDSEAVKILFNKDKRAYGVVYQNHGKAYTAIARKEVIVSGGAINSPKLLMLSGIGPKEHLKQFGIPLVQDLAVGENLHDHVTFNGIVIALPNKTATTVSNEEVIESVFDYAKSKIKDGPLSGNGPVSSIAFIKTQPNLPAPDIQYQVDNVNWEEFVRDPITTTKITIFPTAFYNGLLPRTMNLVPKSRGVLLLNATNPHGPPFLYPNYFGDDTDLIPIIKGVQFLISLENTHAFKSRGAHFVKIPLPACKDYEWGTDEYTVCLARQYTSTPYHPVGTCKMGPHSDPKAVVDPTLKVYGVANLRVIDASIMPIVPRGNTNAPSILVGERGVAFVLDDWLHEKPHL